MELPDKREYPGTAFCLALSDYYQLIETPICLKQVISQDLIAIRLNRVLLQKVIQKLRLNLISLPCLIMQKHIMKKEVGYMKMPWNWK